MPDIFEIIEIHNQDEENKKGMCVGIDVRIADRKISCPVSKVCRSYEELAIEIEAIQNNLEQLLKKAKALFGKPSSKELLDLTADMTCEEIWTKLSEIEEEDVFIQNFNSLDDSKRRQLAEYILTRCNIFSEKASVFSARYNDESGLME